MKIQIPENCKYLSDAMSDLPYNVIFDKGSVGCGGTTLALSNDENYIIAVPYVSLIQNKTKQNQEILGVYATTTEKQIKDYLKFNRACKIMVTYDSLCRILDFIEPSEYRLLVDEYHLLFTNVIFRSKAVNCVLDNYARFKSYCFMTATLLEKDFILKELKHIPIIEAEWHNVRTVNVHSMKCEKSVIPTVNNIIIKFLNNEIEGNAYFFVNSVEFIKQIVSIHNLNDDNSRGVWSKSNKINVGITLGTTLDPPKKINFFTSTCFEGVDLYDEDAKIYIISDKSKSHTLVDISTSFQQIANRVRNTKYWNVLHHIYTTTRYDVAYTYEEFKFQTYLESKNAQSKVLQLNGLTDDVREVVSVEPITYIHKKNNYFEFDENFVKLDLYNFKITKCLYKLRVNLSNEYKKNGYKVIETDSLIKDKFKVSNVFKDICIELRDSINDEDYKQWCFIKYPFLKIAIDKLGWNKIEELKYNKNHIKRYCIKHSNIGIQDKIIEQLNTYNYDISSGVFVSNVKLKEILEIIYFNLNIDKNAKAIDIIEYKQCKPHKKMIKGVLSSGYIML
jgi:hypothetical protein